MRILVGVSGGIAAYKAVTLVRLLRSAGHEVRVIPTACALRMVGQPTWEAIAGHPVHADVFAEPAAVNHVTAARDADALVIAPATADLLARLRAGRADDMLTATALNMAAPVIVFPAMHTAMWTNPATRENVACLRERGVIVCEPAQGALSSGDSGTGRLPEPGDIVARLNQILAAPAGWMQGMRVLISAGGTREPLDPVRYLANRSTGRMGCALAGSARDAGADVTLVAANVDKALIPRGVRVLTSPDARSLHGTMLREQPQADLVIMAAAVADYRPAAACETKIKKGEDGQLTLHLVQNPDILAALVAAKPAGQTVVGFAAETGDHRSIEELALAKLARKGCDYLVANRVGTTAGFGNVSTAVQVFACGGAPSDAPVFTGTKPAIAPHILRHVTGR